MTGVAAGRFPGFDVLTEARHWDTVTAEAVTSRTGPPPEPRFFTETEQACAAALLDQLTGQCDQGQGDEDLQVPVLQMIDARLAADQTDGWRYADMPEDGQAWRDTLGYLDKEAHTRCGSNFADAPERDQRAMLQAVQDGGDNGGWHGLAAARVWSLWTRYACTALYSHPYAWSEIGFPGPAYPRGYKNMGVGKREPFEVRDARPGEDPVGDDA
ncbi:MAG TPA: gluconate 2-dehydrogenase subunit 3 family protein [Trebonia sp.]|nr:gluconate 2-dehydrogenase subunit 3 family protein [Trebonia sp.]